MGTIGPYLGYLQPKFAFTRSYVDRFLLPQSFQPTDTVGRHYIMRPTPYPGLTFYITIKEKFWEWSSNNFTLDYILEDNYLIVDGDPTLYPQGYWLKYIPPTPTAGSAIAYEFLGHGAPYSDGGLPPRDAPYWLPENI